MIFANKQDIQGSMSSTEIRDVRPINNLPPFLLTCVSQALDLDSIRSHQWRILPCSAVTGQNLIEGLDWVVGDVANRLYYGTTAAATNSWQSGGRAEANAITVT